MHISLSDLVRALRDRCNVLAFNIPSNRIITDIQPMPDNFDPVASVTPEGVLYICEYRLLKKLNPFSALPPLICVAEAHADTDASLLSAHCVAVIFGSTLIETLTELIHIAYIEGGRSSPTIEASQRLMSCKSLREILDEGFRILGNPLVLTDSDQEIITATNPDLVSDVEFRMLLAARVLPTGNTNILPDASFPVDGNPLLWEKMKDRLPAAVCKPLSVMGAEVGYLHAFSTNRDFDENDTYVFELIANLCSVGIKRSPIPRKLQENNETARYLRRILNCHTRDASAALEQGSPPVQFKKNLYCAVIYTTKSYVHSGFDELIRVINNTYPDCTAFLYKNALLILINSDKEISDFQAYFSEINAKKEFKYLDMGVSNCFSSVSELRHYVYQARMAIRLGRIEDPDRKVYLYNTYAVYHLLDTVIRRDPTIEFRMPEIDKLAAYCEEYGTELMDTLAVYLRCNRSKAQTAKEMSVHINTVKYRVAQIQLITGLDLNDDSVAMKLLLSKMFLQHREKSQNADSGEKELPQP